MSGSKKKDAIVWLTAFANYFGGRNMNSMETAADDIADELAALRLKVAQLETENKKLNDKVCDLENEIEDLIEAQI